MGETTCELSDTIKYSETGFDKSGKSSLLQLLYLLIGKVSTLVDNRILAKVKPGLLLDDPVFFSQSPLRWQSDLIQINEEAAFFDAGMKSV